MTGENSMTTCIVEKPFSDGYHNFRIPGLVCTGKDSILVYYECRKSVSDWAEIDIGMRKSVDGGKTWSKRRILAHGGGKTVNNPVMFADGETLLFLWQEEYSRTFLRKSRDEGETWGEIREITADTKTPLYEYTVIACGPGHGTVLRDGRYIVPVWLARNPENPKAHAPSIVSTLYSDDRGETWRLGELIQGEEFNCLNETALAQTSEGVLLNIRHQHSLRRRLLCSSADGAGGWGGFRYAQELPDPRCAGGMISAGERLYFTNCRDEEKRIRLTLSRSDDGGRSWARVRQIAETAGYSDLAVSRRTGRIFVFYEEWSEACEKERYLRFAALEPEDV